MKLKSISLILFILGFGFTVFAQDASIKGTVISSDELPLEFVNVGIQSLSKGATTDRFGTFEIKNIPPGTYEIFASLVGAKRQTKTIQLQPGQEVALSFRLEESSTQLAEVVVSDQFSNRFYVDSSFTVAKLPLTDLENPQVYQSISSKLLKEQVVTNMNEAMKNATGVTRLWESTGRGGDGAEYYSMRGFSVQPTMVNGLPSVNNAALDPANIESIEVIKGPSGTLYGSPLISYGGLINVSTKRPMNFLKGELGFITGSFGLNRVTGDINLPLSDQAFMRVNTAYQSQNTFQDAGTRKSFYIAPSFKLKANDRLTFLINTEFLDSEAANAPMIFLNRNAPLSFNSMELFEENYFRSFTSNELTMRNSTFAIQAQALYKISDSWTSQTALSRSSTKSAGYYHYLWDQSNGDEFVRYISNRNGQTLTTDVQQNFIGEFALGQFENKMVVGLDFYESGLSDGSSGWLANGTVSLQEGTDTGDLTRAGVDDILKGTFVGNSMAKTQVVSAYVSDVIAFTPKLSAMASLRVDRFSDQTESLPEDERNEQVALSPKFGLVYQPVKDKVSIFGNYMNGFVNVAPRQVSNADGSNPRVETFSPEQANQWELGVKTSLYKDKLAATVSYYSIGIDNRIMADPANINDFIQGGSVESKGLEFSLVANPINGLNIVAGYSKNSSEVTADNPENGYLGMRPEEAGPDRLINFWASYTAPQGLLKGFGVGFGGNAASEHLTLNRSTTGTFALPAYEVFNASLSYSGPQYLLALKVNNLTDELYYSGWSTVTPQNTRNISLALNYRF